MVRVAKLWFLFIALLFSAGMFVGSAVAQGEQCIFFLETTGEIQIHGYDELGTSVQIFNSADELVWEGVVGVDGDIVSGLEPGTYKLVGPPDGRNIGAVDLSALPDTDAEAALAEAAFVAAVAGPLEVITVPWIATALSTPHTAYNGHATTFKAIARGGTGTYLYEWDFEDDGAYDFSATTTNSYNLSAQHTYPDQASNRAFIARIRVTSGIETVTGEYPVLVMVPNTLQHRINVAIDDGLWYLHTGQTRGTYADGQEYGYWDYGGWVSATASAIQAFEVNGHLEAGPGDVDPYVETVSRGLKYMFTRLNSVAIGPQVYGDPDTNGNGIGIQPDRWRPIYELGQVMDAIAATLTPEAVATTGGSGIIHQTYYDILTDMVDMYAWGQYDDPTVGGGWRYSWNDWPDNSAAQWGAIGMLAAEEVFGIPIPQWVKDRNDVWLDFSYNNPGFGYTDSGYTGDALTPSGMVQLAFDDKLTTDSRWVTAEAWVANNWDWWMTSGNFYAYYAFMKAMREAQQDADPEPDPIVNLSATGLDWYGDPDVGMARRLVDWQAGNGGWPGGWWTSGYLQGAWAVIILKALFEPPPEAIAAATPQEANPGDVITFDHSESLHWNPEKTLVAFRWDFDEDGSWDYETDDIDVQPTHRYFDDIEFCDEIIEHIVTLQVEDEDGKTDEDSQSVIIRISKYNHPPVADADATDSDPNYKVGKGGVVMLDASQSYDPDSDETPFSLDLPQDHIVSWEWDLNNDGVYDIEGETALFDTPDTWEVGSNHTVHLKVTDDGTWAGPCGGSLSSEATAVIHILPCITDVGITIYPDTFNKSRYGKWITGHIAVPDGYEAADIVRVEIVSVDGIACSIPGKINLPEPVYQIPDDPESPVIGHLGVAKFDSRTVAGLLPDPGDGSAGEGSTGRAEDVPICVIVTFSNGSFSCDTCDTIDVIDQPPGDKK